MAIYQIKTGDCRIELPLLADCSVDSVVTDPPYHLTTNKKGGTGLASLNANSPAGRSRVTTGFMGKAWDGGDVAHDPAVWLECLRVLKPGGHLLAFGGSRTYHRLACAIEDAGFEIRDQIQWIYGSGFPKSLDVSKAIDVAAGAEREVIGISSGPNNSRYKGDRYTEKRETAFGVVQDQPNLTAPTTDAAKQWDGWGTALKPAHEPIVLARKPLIGTVAENVLQHRTGGLNIDGCRIETSANDDPRLGGNGSWRTDKAAQNVYEGGYAGEQIASSALGRWPANVIHDGSGEVLAAFPDAPGQQGDLNGHSRDRLSKGIFGDMKAARDAVARLDTGSAARFFYCAKASQEDRSDGCEGFDFRVADTAHKRSRTELDDPRRAGVTPRQNHHPTVKPTDLMRYLCRLVTPPNGTVLDPFCGSGSTGRGALLEGFNFIGIELDAEYCAIAEKRIEAVTRQGLLSFA